MLIKNIGIGLVYFCMEAPEWIRSDIHRELKNAINFARGEETRRVSRTLNNKLSLEEDVSPEDVRLVLDNVTDDELRDLAGQLAKQFHKQDVSPKASDTGGGQRVMADGGGFFEGRSGRVFFVTLSIINTGMATTYLQSDSPISAIFPIAALVLSLSMYLLSEYEVEIDVQ